MRRGIQNDIHSVMIDTPRQNLNVVDDRALGRFWYQPRGPARPDWLPGALVSSNDSARDPFAEAGTIMTAYDVSSAQEASMRDADADQDDRAGKQEMTASESGHSAEDNREATAVAGRGLRGLLEMMMRTRKIRRP
jgi:hypothetical protein